MFVAKGVFVLAAATIHVYCSLSVVLCWSTQFNTVPPKNRSKPYWLQMSRHLLLFLLMVVLRWRR